MKQFALIFLSITGLSSALDLQLDKIQCDASLPAYAEENGISMTCSGNTKCTMGDYAIVSGESKFLSQEVSFQFDAFIRRCFCEC